MEEVLVIILQFLIELVVEIAIWGGLDALVSRWLGSDKPGCLLGGGALALGVAMGGIANLVMPAALLPFAWVRVANLIVGPPTVGWLARLWAQYLNRHGHKLDPRDHFWMGFWFRLAFDVVRFGWAQR